MEYYKRLVDKSFEVVKSFLANDPVASEIGPLWVYYTSGNPHSSYNTGLYSIWSLEPELKYHQVTKLCVIEEWEF